MTHPPLVVIYPLHRWIRAQECGPCLANYIASVRLSASAKEVDVL